MMEILGTLVKKTEPEIAITFTKGASDPGITEESGDQGIKKS